MLSSRFPPLEALEVLLAVARTGSLHAASAQVGVSQQAVSARIASVEAQTGLVLVTRTPRGSTLTPAGVAVAEWAAHLLEVAGEVDAGIASLRDDQRRNLRVSASLTIAEHLLPAWLVALGTEAARREVPAPQIVLRSTNSAGVVTHVREGTADLGFIEGPTAPRGLRSRSVGRDRLLIVVRPDHPWARRHSALTVPEIAGTALVTREEGSGTRTFLDVALRSVLGAGAELTPPVLTFSTSSAVRAAVLAGAGPAVLSELAVRDDLSAGRLRTVRVETLRLERTLRAIWHGGSSVPAGAARDLVTLAVRRNRQP